MKRKSFATFIIALMGAAVLAGCAKDPGVEAADKPEDVSEVTAAEDGDGEDQA